MLIFVISTLFGQQADSTIEYGIQKFYQAEFEQSIDTLQSILVRKPLNQDQLFKTHLFIAFSKYRLDYIHDNIDMHLRQAVEAKPDTTLDRHKFPPDLYQRYVSIRNKTLGSCFITSNPDNASLIVVDLGTKRMREYTIPVLIYGKHSTKYSLLISKDNRKAHTETITIRSGKSDTLNISLEKDDSSLLQRFWPYGAGVLLTGIFIIVQLNDSDSNNDKKSIPLPPDRPQQIEFYD